MALKLLNFRSEAVAFWALICLLILIFFTGGGSRGDISSLIILRPAAVIFCGISLRSLRWAQVKMFRFLLGMAAVIFAVALLHLVPVPPALWGALPGRGIINEIDQVAGLGAVWRPITLAPSNGWNAFYALFVPLAVLLLGAQLNREQRFALLPWLLGLGLLSGFLGMLQAIGDPQSILYFYRVTNNGAAVGFFANRNHQAILLAMLIPMLAVYASTGVSSEEQLRVRGWLAIAAGVILVPLLLVTGSRAGLITGVLGLLAIAILYRRPAILVPKKRKTLRISWRYPLIALGVLCLVALSVIMSRAEALNRLTSSDSLEGERFQLWPEVLKLVWKYFPTGSGSGSFEQAYQIDEPIGMLSPEYFNHAHNDWLEVAMTFGLPGMILMAIALLAVGKAAYNAFLSPTRHGRDAQFAQLGIVLICLIGLTSIGDYPLRTPIMASVFIIATVWISGADSKRGSRAIETRLANANG
jgi:O-antigen ligase